MLIIALKIGFAVLVVAAFVSVLFYLEEGMWPWDRRFKWDRR